jgi:hypothetical protein
MNKRYLHHLWTRLRPVKTWYFLAAFVLCATLCALALRANYTRMVELREVVYQADQNNGDVEAALQDLRAYVNAHMNTNLSRDSGVYPPIQLKYTYERLKKAEQDRVNAANSQIYPAAQQHCERLHPSSFSGRARVPCIQQYVKDHGTQAKEIPADLYRFSFTTPRWSPDLAGWTLVLSILFALLTLVRFLLGRILRAISK